jgi:lambda repressor-like predicted transcriptional regulator
MDREWLASQLEAGRSLESLGRELGVAPATVAYWANKHGLTSSHAARYASRGGIDRATLAALVDEGLSIRAIAAQLDVSYATVRHWLRRHGLQTRLAAPRRDDPAASSLMWQCRVHGWTRFHRVGDGRVKCAACNKAAVTERRRRVKALLVEEHGGACAVCGFDAFAGALQFHHIDPAAKQFELGGRGLTRSLATLRREAAKCVLLCANCHAMVEAGAATLPEALISRAVLPTIRGSSDAG